MRREASLAARALRAFRRHERAAVALYLAGTLAAVAVYASPVRSALLRELQAVLDYWDARWTRRVAQGEALVEAGRHDAAVAYLERLDAAFPARLAKHGRDRERQRVLELLASSHAALGRKGRTLDTYRRLVAFDPRAYRSHFLLASACAALGEPEEALAHYRAVLDMHPSHTDSVRGAAALLFARGAFGDVTALYERYLDGYWIQWVDVELGGGRAVLHVPVDGRFHAFRAALPLPAGAPGDLVVRPGAFPIEIGEIALHPPLRVGRAPAGPPHVIAGGDGWSASGLRERLPGVYDGAGENAHLRLRLPERGAGVAEVHLRVRLFKPLDAELWELVARSYRNRLDRDGLAAARARSLLPARDAGAFAGASGPAP